MIIVAIWDSPLQRLRSALGNYRRVMTAVSFELALACDLRFAAEGEYRIGLPEVNLGLFPGSGGTQRLPRLVGLSRGIDLIANATNLTPAQAHEMGIIDRLFPSAGECRAGA